MFKEVRDSLQQPYRFQILNLDKGAYNDDLLGFDLERSIKKFIFRSLKKYKIYWDSSKLTILNKKNENQHFIIIYQFWPGLSVRLDGQLPTENHCKHFVFSLADKNKSGIEKSSFT